MWLCSRLKTRGKSEQACVSHCATPELHMPDGGGAFGPSLSRLEKKRKNRRRRPVFGRVFFVNLAFGQSVSLRSISWSQSFPAQSSDPFSSGLFHPIHTGRRSLLLTASYPAPTIRGRKEGRITAEPWERKEWTGEAKRKTRSAARVGRLPLAGPGVLSAARGGSVGWLGSDDILAS